MMKLMFYRGPGNLITRMIRILTFGPYSHVELQFTNGRRFFTSGHGVFRGAHMVRDHKSYDPLWDAILIPATQEQEDATQRAAFALIGLPFDFRGLFGFLLPDRPRHKGKYCSAVILDVLQTGLHMFSGVKPKVSPNGLHKLFLYHKHTLTCDCVPAEPLRSESSLKHLQSAVADIRLFDSSLPEHERPLDAQNASSTEKWFH